MCGLTRHERDLSWCELLPIYKECVPPPLFTHHWSCTKKATTKDLPMRGCPVSNKPRLVNKIAVGMAMGLSGPTPTFAKLGVLLGKQVFKGIKDNVAYYCKRQQGRIASLSPLVLPAFAAVHMAAVLGGVGAAANFDFHKGLAAVTKKRKRRRGKGGVQGKFLCSIKKVLFPTMTKMFCSFKSRYSDNRASTLPWSSTVP